MDPSKFSWLRSKVGDSNTKLKLISPITGPLVLKNFNRSSKITCCSQTLGDEIPVSSGVEEGILEWLNELCYNTEKEWVSEETLIKTFWRSEY